MEKIIPRYASKNKGHYTSGIISNGMLYISGQLSIDPDTQKVANGGIEEHARLALANLDRILNASNCCRTDVVQCRIYISEIEQWDAVNRVYMEFFEEHKPARIVVPVGQLHFGCLVEIEAIAEVTEK